MLSLKVEVLDSDMLLHFQATTRQMWLVSKIEPKFGTFRPLQNLGKGWAKSLNKLIKFNL